jgi:O-antigen ligase
VTRVQASLPFRLTVVCLLLEFARPQSLLPFLAPLRLPFLAMIALSFALLLAGKFDLSDKQSRLFLALLTLMALHVPLAVNYGRAFFTLKDMLLMFVLYLGIVMFIDTVSRFRTFIPLWLGIHVFMAIHGIASRGRGIGGFLGDENDFAMAMNMIAPFPFFLAQAEQKSTKRLLYLGLSGLFVLAVIFTFSRGGFVGLLAVMICCCLRSPKKLRSVAVIVVLALLASLYAREGYMKRIESAWEEGISAGTGEDRMYMWRFGWKMFMDNPAIGVGQGNFEARFADYEGDERLYGVTRTWRAAHSLYLTLLPELGLVGGVIFFMMMRYLLKDLGAIRRSTPQRFGQTQSMSATVLPYANAMEASLWGFLISSIFISTLYYPSFWVMMGFVVALRRSVTLQAAPSSAAKAASDSAAKATSDEGTRSSPTRNRLRPR